jgi:mono/diheme cytochrome c family protein
MMKGENAILRLFRGLVLSLVFAAIAVIGANAQEDSQQEMLQLGARIYAENCEVCHGENGAGRVGATLSKDWPSIRPDLAVESTIRSGVEGSVMPAWSRENGGPLMDDDIDALVLYILSWETGGLDLISPIPSPTARPPITPIPEVQGDPNNGAVLYDQNCAMCHGVDGKGRVGATLDRVWTSIRPDLSVENTVRNGVEGSVMPAWSMENGGPLTEAEIDDVVSYILTLSDDNGIVVFTPQPEPETLPSGWVGIVITVVLLAVVVGLILLLQRRFYRFRF